MAGKPLSGAAIDEILRVYQETGGNGVQTAQRLGIDRATVYKYIKGFTPQVQEVTDGGPGPDYRFRFTVRPKADVPGERWRVLAIGDAHSSPGLSGDRFLWIGRHAYEWANRFPDENRAIVQIGDLGSFDSLCRFDGNETVAGRLKPSFENDIDGIHRDLAEFDRGLQGFEPNAKHVTLGNHEDRVVSFTNRNPEVYGVLTGMFDNVLMTHKWTYSPFGGIYFLGGVGFTHYPLTTLGKPYGGKTALQRACNDLLHDLVVGHDHKTQHIRMPKIGARQSVQILGLGSALPHGHLENYIKHDQMAGWSYGIFELLIDENSIQSTNYIAMLELQERYS